MENVKYRLYILIFFINIFPAMCLADKDEEIRLSISNIERAYGIKIFYKNIPQSTWKELKYTKASPLDKEQLLEYLRLFDGEFRKYPKNFIKRTKLKCVALVKQLSISGQVRAAIPDYYKEILFLDFAHKNNSDIYLKHVIHHEFYHMIEKQFNGDAYWKDPNWARLNEKDFKYGMGGAFAQGNSDMYAINHLKKGFINLYSMSALEEDKAEIYASLFIEPENRKVNEWIKDDYILNNKVRYIKAFIFKCCKEMDCEYWANLFKAESLTHK